MLVLLLSAFCLALPLTHFFAYRSVFLLSTLLTAWIAAYSAIPSILNTLAQYEYSNFFSPVQNYVHTPGTAEHLMLLFLSALAQISILLGTHLPIRLPSIIKSIVAAWPKLTPSVIISYCSPILLCIFFILPSLFDINVLSLYDNNQSLIQLGPGLMGQVTGVLLRSSVFSVIILGFYLSTIAFRPISFSLSRISINLSFRLSTLFSIASLLYIVLTSLNSSRTLLFALVLSYFLSKNYYRSVSANPRALSPSFSILCLLTPSLRSLRTVSLLFITLLILLSSFLILGFFRGADPTLIIAYYLKHSGGSLSFLTLSHEFSVVHAGNLDLLRMHPIELMPDSFYDVFSDVLNNLPSQLMPFGKVDYTSRYLAALDTYYSRTPYYMPSIYSYYTYSGLLLATLKFLLIGILARHLSLLSILQPKHSPAQILYIYCLVNSFSILRGHYLYLFLNFFIYVFLPFLLFICVQRRLAHR